MCSAHVLAVHQQMCHLREIYFASNVPIVLRSAAPDFPGQSRFYFQSPAWLWPIMTRRFFNPTSCFRLFFAGQQRKQKIYHPHYIQVLRKPTYQSSFPFTSHKRLPVKPGRPAKLRHVQHRRRVVVGVCRLVGRPVVWMRAEVNAEGKNNKASTNGPFVQPFSSRFLLDGYVAWLFF